MHGGNIGIKTLPLSWSYRMMVDIALFYYIVLIILLNRLSGCIQRHCSVTCHSRYMKEFPLAISVVCCQSTSRCLSLAAQLNSS